MTLPGLLRKLKALYGPPAAPPLRDPYLLLLFEQVGYLAGDADRLAAFRLLQSRVGTRPEEILAARTATLRAIARRLGYGKESPEWKRSYRSAQADAVKELPKATASLRGAYLLLKHHGQTLCRRSAPRCRECPLQAECPTGRQML